MKKGIRRLGLPSDEAIGRYAVVALLLATLLIALFEPLRATLPMRVGTWCVLLLTGVALLLLIREGRRDMPCLLLLLMGVLAAALLIGERALAPSLSVNMAVFFVLPVLLLYLEGRGDGVSRRAVYAFGLTGGIWYALLSFTPLSNIYYCEDGSISDIPALTLGLTNANQTAMHLMVCFFILLSAFFAVKDGRARTGLAVLLTYLAILIWDTGSRTALLLSLAVVVLTLLRRWVGVRGWYVDIAMSLPLLFIPASMLGEKLLGGVTLLGDAVDTGRARIFWEVFGRLGYDGVWLGDFRNYLFGNQHNLYVSVIASAGIPMLLLFLGFLWRMLRSAARRAGTDAEQVALYGLLALVVQGATEAAFFTRGGIYAGSVLALYLLVCGRARVREDSE